MARYTRQIPLAGPPEMIFAAVRQYLEGEGFQYIHYRGEDVFCMGNGFWTAPTFIKIGFTEGHAQVESWIMNALLPNVFVGEYGMSGAGRKRMKKYVPQVEQLAGAAYDQPEMPQSDPQPRCCLTCCVQAGQEDKYCPNCGQALPEPDPQPAPFFVPQALLPKEEFLRSGSSHAFRKSVSVLSVFLYGLIGIDLIMLLTGSLSGQTDWAEVATDLLILAFFLGMALGYHRLKSKTCAIGLLILSSFNTLIWLLAVQQVVGWWWILISVAAVSTIASGEKEYANYRAGAVRI